MAPILADNGTPVTSAELNQRYAKGDGNTFTVTENSTPGYLSTPYVIPAFDASVGTAYRITCGGWGTWATTTHVGVMLGHVFGSTYNLANQFNITSIASSVFALTATFRWKCTLFAVAVTIGEQATWALNGYGCMTQSTNNVKPATAANNTCNFALGGPSGVNTLATASSNDAIIFALGGKMTLTDVTQVITTTYSLFERID